MYRASQQYTLLQPEVSREIDLFIVPSIQKIKDGIGWHQKYTGNPV